MERSKAILWYGLAIVIVVVVVMAVGTTVLFHRPPERLVGPGLYVIASSALLVVFRPTKRQR